MRILVSACLMGRSVRYDGRAKTSQKLLNLKAAGADLIEVCPELLGGLRVPRPPAELNCHGEILTKAGQDVTDKYKRGAKLAADTATANLVPLAILKDKSPACATKLIYDGTHQGKLIAGQGVAVKALIDKGVFVMNEIDIASLEPTVEHPIALVLGSGLAHLMEQVKVVRRIPYTEIEGFPDHLRPVSGHVYEALVGMLDAVPVVVYPGRIHLYQGITAAEQTCLVRHAYKLGCRSIVLTCASGALPQSQLGLAVHVDQLNLTATSPLEDPYVAANFDSPFIDMSQAYHPYFIELAKMVAAQQQIHLQEAVYAGLRGPAYETPAEAKYLEKLGATHVGMSMVNEVIMARALDMNVLGITLATNYAGAKDVNHAEVLKASKDASASFELLIRGVLTLL